ncbi:MAG TPA: TonB family protein [Vicinamibacterales bacterium]|nr:TonB family protein [Vicinamibacterales bacterium]
MLRFVLVSALLGLVTAPAGVAPAQFRSGELPAIPVLAVRGGALILDVAVGRDGSVRGIKVTQSTLQFADAVIATVKSWRFRPAGEAASPVDSTVLVAVVFRPPSMYAPSTTAPTKDDGSAPKDAPFPLRIVTPSAPPRAGTPGVALVEVRVGANGAVSGLKIVRSAPGFDDAVIQAARRWTFRPAEVGDVKVLTLAYVIFGFP